MAKRRESWARLYDGIRVVRRPDSVCMPPVADAELDELESQLGSRLPQSYREFMKRFGSGELQGWVRIYPIVTKGKRTRSTVADTTTAIRAFFQKHKESLPNHRWLSSIVYFASSGGGDQYVWDPAAVTGTRPPECQFYYLPRHQEDNPVEAGSSFWRFVEWVHADVLSWQDPQRLEEDGPGLYFCPTYLRSKKNPLKREVKLWLAWKDGTVLKLAKSIREQRSADAFPVLADALEEAGCTNPDLLTSCRCSTPEIDGTWVLQVLLGKE
jgi:hypothetical protein